MTTKTTKKAAPKRAHKPIPYGEAKKLQALVQRWIVEQQSGRTAKASATWDEMDEIRDGNS